MPQKLIDLGSEWEFVCFVNHTQMAEQKLFAEDKETNCHIMFIARHYHYNGTLKLMSFKCNPWLNMDHSESEHDSDIRNIDLFIFSGGIEATPGMFNFPGGPPRQAQKKKFCRQYYSDKI